MNRIPTPLRSRLRRIGWDEWDPIGILRLNDHDWRHEAADEYDTYLLHGVNLLRSGAPVTEAVEYLDKIASEYMALGPITATGHIASLKTVEAIDAYRRLPDV